jgi:hypothetical protein
MARRWIEQSGVQAFVSYQKLQGALRDRGVTVPDWLDASPNKASTELVKTSRAALEAIATGEDEDAKAWLKADFDWLHVNVRGYLLWTAALAPVLRHALR